MNSNIIDFDFLAFSINNIMYNWNVYDYEDNFSDLYQGYKYLLEHLKDADFRENVIDELENIADELTPDEDLNTKLYGFTYDDIVKIWNELNNL